MALTRPLSPSAVMKWEQRNIWDGVCPHWEIEPSIDTISDMMHSKIRDLYGEEEAKETTLTISYFGSGAFNKLYLIERSDAPDKPWLLRVTLPVDPVHKTASEVSLSESSPHCQYPR